MDTLVLFNIIHSCLNTQVSSYCSAPMKRHLSKFRAFLENAVTLRTILFLDLLPFLNSAYLELMFFGRMMSIRHSGPVHVKCGELLNKPIVNLKDILNLTANIRALELCPSDRT